MLHVGLLPSAGPVFIVVMAMQKGAFFVGMISPQLAVLLKARVAASAIYKTIDRVCVLNFTLKPR